MIQYALDPAKLKQDIQKEDAGWFAKAAERTAKLKQLKKYEESSAIWSAAKPAFMILQFNKCVFCERQFTRPDESRIEMDLEHFRPKSSVKAWTPPTGANGYPANTGPASDKGYYWLAYSTDNYAASCKICNSEYKSNYFPISGAKRTSGPTARNGLRSEKHFLCYPIGTADTDPEELITFAGTVAIPVASSGFQRERARLIIDFFGLNARDQLHIQRAEIIERFGLALRAVANNSAQDADRTYVAQIGNPLLPHSACLRAFNKLWGRNRADAGRILDACRNMLASLVASPQSRNDIGLGIS